jgi:hypothetical protein
MTCWILVMMWIHPHYPHRWINQPLQLADHHYLLCIFYHHLVRFYPFRHIILVSVYPFTR